MILIENINRTKKLLLEEIVSEVDKGDLEVRQKINLLFKDIHDFIVAHGMQYDQNDLNRRLMGKGPFDSEERTHLYHFNLYIEASTDIGNASKINKAFVEKFDNRLILLAHKAEHFGADFSWETYWAKKPEKEIFSIDIDYSC